MLYYWNKHYQRLSTSASRLGIQCPSEDLLLDDISILLVENGLTNAVIKIILSRGSSGRGYHYPDKISAKRLVMLSPFDTENSSLLTGNISQGELFLCKNHVSTNSSLAGIKHLNRLDNVQARNEWQDKGNKLQGYADGLMLDDKQRVIECTSSNIFAVRGDQLFTPDLTSAGVNGVMRDATLMVCDEIGIESDICELYTDDLKKMDEIFITNSLIGLKSINNFLDSSYASNVTSATILTALQASAKKYAHTLK
jgi:4-amino-4-deoxychorismate lyase